MDKKVIFCTVVAWLTPWAQASDTAHSNISLRIPERVEVFSMAVASEVAVRSEDSIITKALDFCVAGTHGLQFSVVSDNPEQVTYLKLGSALANRDQLGALHSDNAKECHEGNSGVLRVTQLPQGTRTVTAVVVVE